MWEIHSAPGKEKQWESLGGSPLIIYARIVPRNRDLREDANDIDTVLSKFDDINCK